MTAVSEANQIIGGRYALEATIGKGGMGEVWRARHLALKSPVAIKFLHGTSASSDVTRKRFLTEAQVTASLKTRHAVHVFDYGVTDEGVPYLVMELLEGETLDARIGRLGHLPVKMTVRLLRQAARALDRAHALGIVHRDFKPENIVILQDEEGNDEVKILDFGVARLIGELEPTHEATGDEHGLGKSPMTTFTRTGTIIGTPYYMAPEQIKDSSQVGPPADIWALGVVAYECITGRRPFEGETIAAVLQGIIERRYTSASKLGEHVPILFDDWFESVCAPTPTARFPDALTAVVALGIALEDPIPSAAPSDRESVDLTAGFRTLPQTRPVTSALAETLVAGPALGSGVRVQHVTPAPEVPAAEQPPTGTSLTGLTRSAAPASRRVPILVGVAFAICALSAVAFVVLGGARAPQGAASTPTGASTEAASAEAAAPSEARHEAAPPASAATSRPGQTTDAPQPVFGNGRLERRGAAAARPSADASAAPSAPPAAPAAPGTPASAHAPPPPTAPTGASPYKLPDLGL